MIPADDLILETDGFAPLVEPILLVALAGLFDAAGVATAALDLVADPNPDGVDGSVIVGEIDPDRFYDFTMERPTVEVVDEDSVICWPSNAFRTVRTGLGHDLVVLSGVEPHLRWRAFIACIMDASTRLGIVKVVTLGSTADVIPHTRMPVVVGSTSNPALAGEFALAAPTYQGVTGLVGALHAVLEEAAVPSISLRVGVPHYLVMGEHPRAVSSLLLHAAHVVGVPIGVDLREAIDRWDEVHTASIAEDDNLRRYVEVLEVEYDRRAEAAVTPADDLAASFEDFLRASGEPGSTDSTDDAGDAPGGPEGPGEPDVGLGRLGGGGSPP